MNSLILGRHVAERESIMLVDYDKQAFKDQVK